MLCVAGAEDPIEWMSRNNFSIEMPIAHIRAKFLALKPALDERLTRLWAGAEAEAIGEGGITIVARATGMSRRTIRAGRDELRKGLTTGDVVRVRRAGAGRRSIEEKAPEIVDALEGLIEPVTRGDRESPLRWTLKSTRTLSAELGQRGFLISPQKVGQLLHARGYSLRSGGAPPVTTAPVVRYRQFEVINARVEAFQARNAPVISVDTRYAELAGDVADRGDEQQRNELVAAPGHVVIDGHLGTLRGRDASGGARHTGWTDADVDHELPAFVVLAITEWWEHMARRARLHAKELLVTVDSVGGGARAHRWRPELQRFADRSGLTVAVSHFPPGTSKWNRVEHRLLCHVTESWRDRPRVDCEVAVRLIGSARMAKRPVAPAALRVRTPETPAVHDGGILLITGESFHGEWNYTLHPCRERSQ
jgi:hypothetical protein